MARPLPTFYGFVGQREITSSIERHVEGSLRQNLVLPHILLSGPSGIGKTELATATANAMGTKCHSSFCSPQTTRSQLAAPCLQLLTARCLNDYRLPDGWLPVAAINPDDGYQVNDLDPALLSRFVLVDVEPDSGDWLEWASGANIHPTVTSYVAQTPDIFGTPESNPRAWTYVSDLVHASEREDGSDDALGTAICGLVGSVHGAAFMGFLSDAESAVNAEAVVEQFPSIRGSVRRLVTDKRVDVLTSVVHQLRLRLQSTDFCARISSTPNQLANIAAFAEELPGDLKKSLASSLKQQGLA